MSMEQGRRGGKPVGGAGVPGLLPFLAVVVCCKVALGRLERAVEKCNPKAHVRLRPKDCTAH